MTPGVLRTTEALIAIAISLIFLVFVLPAQTETPASVLEEDVLHPLRTDASFRTCVLAKNVSCINSTVDSRLDDRFSFLLNLSEDPHAAVPSLPEEKIVTNSLYVAGNLTMNQSLVLRLFYWPR